MIQQNPKDDAELVWVPGGTFLMGRDPNEIGDLWQRNHWDVYWLEQDGRVQERCHYLSALSPGKMPWPIVSGRLYVSQQKQNGVRIGMILSTMCIALLSIHRDLAGVGLVIPRIACCAAGRGVVQPIPVGELSATATRLPAGRRMITGFDPP